MPLVIEESKTDNVFEVSTMFSWRGSVPSSTLVPLPVRCARCLANRVLRGIPLLHS